MKASGAISIVFSSISLASCLARQEIVQRVVERLHVGIDLFLHVAGQEAEPFARLHRRAAEDDLVHMAVDHLVHGDGNGEIGLAGARGPDAEGQFMA
jgi:predicted acyltransferase